MSHSYKSNNYALSERTDNYVPFGFGQTDEIEVELASPWRRIAAVLINSLLYIAVALISVLIAGLVSAAVPSNMEILSTTIKGGLTLLSLFAFPIYQLVLLCSHGYTLGKKWMGIQVIRTTGDDAGFLRAFLLREVVYLLIVALVAGVVGFMIGFGGAFSGMEGDAITSSSKLMGNIIGMLFNLICLIMMFAHSERRTLQDLIGGTVVVQIPRR